MNESGSVLDFLQKMRMSGMPEDEISRKISRYLKKKARETDTPYTGHFELTPLCNLDCKMCYVHLEHDQLKGRKLLSAEEWEGLIQQAVDAGMMRAALSGGECLTYPGFDDVYLFLKSKGIPTTILTNGVLLDRERIRFFQEHRPRKIQVSLYGSSDSAYEEVTGKRVFSSVIGNIVAAKEADLPVKISITPSKYMLADIYDLIKLVKSLDIPYAINLGIMTPREDTGRGDTDHDISIEEYAEIMKYNRMLNNRLHDRPESALPPLGEEETGFANKGLKCGAGRSTFAMNWQGIMNPCTQLTSIAANPLETGFLDAWRSVNSEVKAYPRFRKCDECAYSQACDFCAAENEKQGSRYILNHIWCDRALKMVENGLRMPDPQCD